MSSGRSAEGVGAVHDDIEPRQQVQRIALVDGRLDRFHGQLRVQPAERLRRNLHLWLVEAVDRMNHLPLQVREANAVVIGQPDGAHAGSGEIERCGGAERADADDQDPGTEEAFLSGFADLRQREMAGVALALSQVERRHQTPRDFAGTG